MVEQQTVASESVTEHLRRIGVGWSTRRLTSGHIVLEIRLDKLRVAEGGEWTP